MYSRRSFSRIALQSLAGAAALRAGMGRAGLHAAGAAGAPLRDLAAEKGLLFGSAVRPELLATDAGYADLVAKQCSIIVPEGCLKWRALRPTPDSFDFQAGDAYLAFGEKNHQKVRGHTLVWHSALPAWFSSTVNRGNAKDFLIHHIRTVMGHYAGRIESWDVVNEAINPGGGGPGHLRKTPWLDLIGPEYLDLAYRTAAEADPQAKLFYNDYGLEEGGEACLAKRQAVLELLRGMQKRGVPLHGFGFQSHLSGAEDWQPAPGLAEYVREIAKLGLRIYITEMDVRDDKFPADLAERDRGVAGVYAAYLKMMLAEPAVKAVLCWGITDRSSWLNVPTKRADKLPGRPLPFDDQFVPTAAYDAIAKAFQEAAPRPA